STASGKELLVASGITGTSYTDGGLTNGVAYYYEVTAVNGNGEGALSNEAAATPQAALTSSATFLTADSATQGTWQNAYGADGYDYGPRSERIDVLDAGTGTVLDSKTLSNFSGGQYLVWNVAGHVQFRITNLVGGSNAVISGLFFGGASLSAPAAPANLAASA